MSILVENLSKKYDAQIAVNEISFSISTKKIVGFLGPNGAGKSTTMKILNGFVQADKGKVEIAGIDVFKNPIAAQKKIGYLPEHNPLYTDFYISEYLEFMASVYQLKNPKKRIDEIISLVGLLPEKNKKIEQLSKGYKQRVGIASVLLHNPEVLILDEPTSGLDPIQVIEIRQLIKDLGKEKTILFSTHIMQEVEALCEEVLILHQGNLIANDNLKAIKKKYNLDIIVASFKKELTEKDFNEIENLCSKIYKNEGAWHFETNEMALTKKKLMTLATTYNWELDSIYHQTNSIENIFTTLTKKNFNIKA